MRPAVPAATTIAADCGRAARWCRLTETATATATATASDALNGAAEWFEALQRCSGAARPRLRGSGGRASKSRAEAWGASLCSGGRGSICCVSDRSRLPAPWQSPRQSQSRLCGGHCHWLRHTERRAESASAARLRFDPIRAVFWPRPVSDRSAVQPFDASVRWPSRREPSDQNSKRLDVGPLLRHSIRHDIWMIASVCTLLLCGAKKNTAQRCAPVSRSAHNSSDCSGDPFIDHSTPK